jgi:exonuclease VII small subunit
LHYFKGLRFLWVGQNTEIVPTVHSHASRKRMDGPLQEALKYIKQAVQLDQQGDYEEAINAYKLGVELCKQAQTGLDL